MKILHSLFSIDYNDLIYCNILDILKIVDMRDMYMNFNFILRS